MSIELMAAIAAMAMAIIGPVLAYVSGQGQATKYLMDAANSMIKPLTERLEAATARITVLETTVGTQANRILELQETVVGLLAENESLRYWAKDLCWQVSSMGGLPVDRNVSNNKIAHKRKEG